MYAHVYIYIYTHTRHIIYVYMYIHIGRGRARTVPHVLRDAHPHAGGDREQAPSVGDGLLPGR